jgi:type I restriction enzyme S subunit
LVDALVEQADSVAANFRADGDVTTFGEVCDVFGGATPKTSEPSYWNGDLHWATPSDITALRSPYLFATSRQITQAGLDACSSDLHPPGSILMTSRATIGAFALAQIPTSTNQGFIVVELRREEDRYFLFHEMRRRVPEFMDRANGSTFMEISRGTFKSLSLEWPSESDRRELARKLEPLHRSAIELEREIAELESRRDELLPLLLWGRVQVDEVAA